MLGGPVLTAPSPDDAARPDQRFRPHERIKKRREFLRVQHHGQRWVCRRLVVLALPSEVGRSRIGLTVSRKVGNAVVRARVKRRLREAWRLHKPEWPAETDVVVIARSAAATASMTRLRDDLFAWARQFRPDASCPPS
jgi:ribonuclease P protein component